MLATLLLPPAGPIAAAVAAGLVGVLAIALLLGHRGWPRGARDASEDDAHGSTTKDLRIKALFIHPIKSCRFIPVQQSAYDTSGLQYDRTWLIVNADDHRFNTARELPQMVLIQPSIHRDTNELRICIPRSSAPGEAEADVVSTPLDPSADFLARCPVLRNIQIWKHKNQDGFAVSSEADAALTRFFGRPVRLVRKGPTPRDVYGGDGDPEGVLTRLGRAIRPAAQDLDTRSVRFQDFLPMLITTDASLEHLRQSLLRSVWPAAPVPVRDAEAAAQLSQGEFDVRSWQLPLGKVDRALWTPDYIHHLPINRYRPNVLLTTGDGPELVGFEEDSWTHLEVFAHHDSASQSKSRSNTSAGTDSESRSGRESGSGSEPSHQTGAAPPYGRAAEGLGLGIFCLARCGRCTVPGIDPDTGVRDAILPARVLQRYRMVDKEQPYSPCFGVLSTPRELSGTLRVGDTVRVTRTGLRPIFKKPDPLQAAATTTAAATAT